MNDIFFEIHADCPRQGPGDSKSTAQAYGMMDAPSTSPLILDVGCGPGMQTRDLSRQSGGMVIAVDYYRQYLHELSEGIRTAGVTGPIHPVCASMSSLCFPEGTFDIIWAEGSAYIMGFGEALREWRPLLKPEGWLALSEAVWLRDDPPAECRAFWEKEYPGMASIPEKIGVIEQSGYRVAGHFTLPPDSWLKEYYAPLEKRLEKLAASHCGDSDWDEMIAVERYEISMYRKYGEYYGYEFFILQRND